MRIASLIPAVMTLAALTAIPLAAAEPATRPAVPRVLIIGIDGCRADALAAADAPRIHALASAGASAEDARCLPKRQTGADTISGPGWSSLLTGVWADKHMALDNKFAGNRFAEHPHFFAHMRSVRPQAHLASVVSWSPIAQHIVSAADENIDAGGKEDAVADRAVGILKERNPDALFVHFDEVDHAGHAKGFAPDVPEYLAAIAMTDKRVGRLLDAMAARPAFKDESWLVIVCSDHGGRGKNHSGGWTPAGGDPARLVVPLILGGPAVRPGGIAGPAFNVDLVPTVLAHLGIPIDPKWKLDGKPLKVEPSAARPVNVTKPAAASNPARPS